MARSMVLTSLVVCAIAAVIYMTFWSGEPPKIPNLDPEQWWGPSETKGKQDKSIRPFKIEFSDHMVKDLKERLARRRKLTPPLEDIGFQYGFNSVYLEKVLDFWQNSYNFKERETLLNKYPHFKTNIQGLDVHFIHIKPKVQSNVMILPLLMLHGWPGSIKEFYGAIPFLTTPQSNRDFVFELIIPSLPGYGFSSAAVRPGLGAVEMSVVMKNLMNRLGHKKFYIQGGDWGALICSNMATLYPDEILGLHTNMPVARTLGTTLLTLIGSIYPSLFFDKEVVGRMYPLSEHFKFIIEETGYMHIQATKPDTIGVGLTDSPAGLAAYIIEKFSTWTNKEFKSLPDGGITKKFTLNDILDNIMIYWSTNSITTSARLYSESFGTRQFAYKLDEIPSPVPTWGLQAPHELLHQPPCLLRYKFPNLISTTVLNDGGHFVAFELPELFAEDVIRAVEAFRKYHNSKKMS